MAPDVSVRTTASGEAMASVSRLGARESAAPLWQTVHSRSHNAAAAFS